MLRTVVVALVLANVLFWVWSRGLLEHTGWGQWASPGLAHEPERMQRQIRPERVRIEDGQPSTTQSSTPIAPSDVNTTEAPAATR